jgi:hypothetical protein
VQFTPTVPLATTPAAWHTDDDAKSTNATMAMLTRMEIREDMVMGVMSGNGQLPNGRKARKSTCANGGK